MPDINVGTAHGSIVLHDKFLPVLKQANAQLDASRKGMERDFGAIRDASGKVATAMLAVGAAGLAMANKTVQAWAQVDDAMDRIRVGTGATGKDLEALGESFRAVAKRSTQDLGSVGQVLADLNTRTGATGESLEKLALATTRVARMTGEEMTGMVAGATRAMGDWGVAADRGAELMDKLFLASQQTGIGITRLSNLVVQYGAPMRQLGFDLDTAIATLAKMEQEGVNTELVMGSLRIALGKLARDGVEDAAGALQKMIKEIQDAGSTGEANAKALELFGARAGPDMAAAIREGRFEVGELVKSLSGAKGAIEENDAATKDLMDRFAELRNRVTLAVEPIGGSLVDALDKATRGLSTMTEEQIKNKAEWALLGAAAVGSAGAITLILRDLPKLIEGLRTARGLLTAPLGSTGLLVLAATVGGAIIIKRGVDEMQEDVANRRYRDTHIAPSPISPMTIGPDGLPSEAPPKWRIGQALPSGIAGLAESEWIAFRGVAPTPKPTPKPKHKPKPTGGSSATGPTPLERELQRLEDAYEFAQLSGNQAQIASTRAALVAFLQRHAGRSGFGLAAMRRLAQVKADAQKETLERERVTQDAERELQANLRANMESDADAAAMEFRMEVERRQAAARRWQEAGGTEGIAGLWQSVVGGVRGGIGAVAGLGSTQGPVFRNTWPDYYARQQRQADALLGIGAAAIGGVQAVGAVGSRLVQAGSQIGAAMKRSMGEAIDWAQRRYREWQRDAEENWERVGRALWWSGGRGGAGQVMSDLGAGAAGRLWETRGWGSLRGVGESLAGWVRGSAVGRALDRNGIGLSDLIGAAGAVGNIASGQGGFMGGAMSGASLGGFFGPVGAGIGALAGGVISAIFQSDNEEERRHREAQERRDRIAEGIRRMEHTLEPVADYFRGLGLGMASAGMTFGGGLAAEAALGARG